MREPYGATALACPHCRGTQMHSGKVTLWNRAAEDAPTMKIEVLSSNAIQPTQSAADNPSDRRQAVAVEFLCEGCDGFLTMHLVQERGSTLVHWTRVPGGPPGRPVGAFSIVEGGR